MKEVIDNIFWNIIDEQIPERTTTVLVRNKVFDYLYITRERFFDLIDRVKYDRKVWTEELRIQ